MLFVMTKRLRQFKVASVLFVLALAAITVIMFAGKPASAALPILDTNFFIKYTASTLEAGDVSTKGGDDLTVKGWSSSSGTPPVSSRSSDRQCRHPR